MNKKFIGTEEEKKVPGQLKAIFTNTGKDPKFVDAKLYFQDTEWGEFAPGKTHSVNTYYGHEWNVKDSKGNLLKRWLVAESPTNQKFLV